MIPTKVFHPVAGSSGSVVGAAKVQLPVPPVPLSGVILSRRIRVSWDTGPGSIAFGPTSAVDATVAANAIRLSGAAGSDIFDLGADQLYITATAGLTVFFVMEW